MTAPGLPLPRATSLGVSEEPTDTQTDTQLGRWVGWCVTLEILAVTLNGGDGEAVDLNSQSVGWLTEGGCRLAPASYISAQNIVAVWISQSKTNHSALVDPRPGPGLVMVSGPVGLLYIWPCVCQSQQLQQPCFRVHTTLWFVQE